MSSTTITITSKSTSRRSPNTSACSNCSIAIIAFCRINGLRIKLSAEPLSLLSLPLLSAVDAENQYLADLAGKKILIVECLHGGKVQELIEELSRLGVRTILSYGYGGALTRTIPIGQLVFAEAAILPDDPHHAAYPASDLLQNLRREASRRCVSVRRARVWTTAEVGPASPDKIDGWRTAGAEVIATDVATLYAVSRQLRISAVYACIVSDCVQNNEWDEAFSRVQEGMQQLQDLIVSALTREDCDAPNCG